MADIINTYIDSLIENTNYEILVQKCIDTNTITIQMMEVMARGNPTTYEKHGALFKKIVAVNKFSNLVNICKEHFPVAALILQPDARNYFNKSSTENRKLSSLSSDQCANLPKLFDVIKPDRKIEPNLFSTFLDYAGVLFFVNYTENRHYASEERDWLLALFHQLNFRIFYLEDQSIDEVHNNILALKQLYLRNVNCFFYIQLGVGTLNNIYFNDNTAIKVSTIIDAFNNKNCANLINVQKVFIFPSVDPSYVTNQFNDFTLEFGVSTECKGKPTHILPQNLPTRSNNLYFYFEHEKDSFLESIKIFCQKVAEFAYRGPLQSILKLYFEARKHAAHSDYREIVEEGNTMAFNIPYVPHRS